MDHHIFLFTFPNIDFRVLLLISVSAVQIGSWGLGLLDDGDLTLD